MITTLCRRFQDLLFMALRHCVVTEISGAKSNKYCPQAGIERRHPSLDQCPRADHRSSPILGSLHPRANDRSPPILGSMFWGDDESSTHSCINILGRRQVVNPFLDQCHMQSSSTVSKGRQCGCLLCGSIANGFGRRNEVADWILQQCVAFHNMSCGWMVSCLLGWLLADPKSEHDNMIPTNGD